MSDRQSLERLWQWAGDHADKLAMIAALAVLIGMSVGVKTGSILAGLVSLVGTVLVCTALWPLIKRFG